VVDLLICREVLFHLSFPNIHKVLASIAKSEAKYLIVTSHEATENTDITATPFSWSPPVKKIKEDFRHNRYVYFYNLAAIRGT
jgi:hypothetical protein